MTLPAITGSGGLVNPRTGEVVPLDAPTDQLADVLDAIRDLEQQLRSAKRDLSAELHRRMDFEGTWTVRAGEWKVSGQSPERRFEYDGERLYGRLYRLMKQGEISPFAVNEAVEEIITYKVKVAGVKRLAKLGGRLAQAVEDCKRPVEGDRRITLSRRTER